MKSFSVAHARPQPFTEPSQRKAAGHEQCFSASSMLSCQGLDLPRPQDCSTSRRCAGRRSRAPGCFGPSASLSPHGTLQPSPGDGEVQQTCSKSGPRLPSDDNESGFHRLWASYGTVDFSPQPALLGKDRWLSPRHHFIGLMA